MRRARCVVLALALFCSALAWCDGLVEAVTLMRRRFYGGGNCTGTVLSDWMTWEEDGVCFMDATEPHGSAKLDCTQKKWWGYQAPDCSGPTDAYSTVNLTCIQGALLTCDSVPGAFRKKQYNGTGCVGSPVYTEVNPVDLCQNNGGSSTFHFWEGSVIRFKWWESNGVCAGEPTGESWLTIDTCEDIESTSFSVSYSLVGDPIHHEAPTTAVATLTPTYSQNLTRAPTMAGAPTSSQPGALVIVAQGSGDPHYSGGTASSPNEWQASCQDEGWQLFAGSETWQVEVHHRRVPNTQVSVIDSLKLSGYSPDTTRIVLGSEMESWSPTTVVLDDGGGSGSAVGAPFHVSFPSPTPSGTDPNVMRRAQIDGPSVSIAYACWSWGSGQAVCQVQIYSPDIIVGIAKDGCPGHETSFRVTAAFGDTGRGLATGDEIQVDERSECTLAQLKEPFLSNCHFDTYFTNDTSFFVARGVDSAKAYTAAVEGAGKMQRDLNLASGTGRVADSATTVKWGVLVMWFVGFVWM